MGRSANLKKGFKQLQGFSYGDNKPIDLAEDFYFALINADTSQPDYSVPLVVSNLTNRLTGLLKICSINEDVYRRLRGDKSFWSFVVAAWNPLHPLAPEKVHLLVSFLLEARRRYISTPRVGNATILTNAADALLKLVDEVKSQGLQQPITSLNAPPAVSLTPGGMIWPPVHFAGIDIAMMAIKGVREKIYALTSTSSPGPATAAAATPAPTPTRLDEPLAIRAHLAHLALTKIQPDASIPTALYLAPVAFLNHSQRAAWYKTTGHKSRLYGTVPEFVEYAHKALSGSKNPKKHAVCLLTPWFFEPAAAKDMARERDIAIPTAWAKSCPRAGMALVITRLKRVYGKKTYRVVVFQPGPPRYPDAVEPLDRKEMQDAWVEKMLGVVDDGLDVKQGHIGGYMLRRYDSGDKTPEDSVELACEFVREVVADPEKAVPGGKGLVQRGFATTERWDDGKY